MIEHASKAKSTTKLNVRCILFDLDGTLYTSPQYSKHLEAEIAKIVSEELSLSQKEATILLNQKRKEIGTLTRNLESLGIDRHQFFQKISNRINPSLYISPNPTTQPRITGTQIPAKNITKPNSRFLLKLQSHSSRSLLHSS